MIKRLSSILEGIIKYSNDRLSPETNLDGMQSRNRAGVKEEQMRKERTPITIFDSNDFDA